MSRGERATAGRRQARPIDCWSTPPGHLPADDQQSRAGQYQHQPNRPAPYRSPTSCNSCPLFLQVPLLFSNSSPPIWAHVVNSFPLAPAHARPAITPKGPWLCFKKGTPKVWIFACWIIESQVRILVKFNYTNMFSTCLGVARIFFESSKHVDLELMKLI